MKEKKKYISLKWKPEKTQNYMKWTNDVVRYFFFVLKINFVLLLCVLEKFQNLRWSFIWQTAWQFCINKYDTYCVLLIEYCFTHLLMQQFLYVLTQSIFYRLFFCCKTFRFLLVALFVLHSIIEIIKIWNVFLEFLRTLNVIYILYIVIWIPKSSPGKHF